MSAGGHEVGAASRLGWWSGPTLPVMAGAAAFMFWGAGYYTVFDDEAFSTQRYVLPAGELIRALWRGVEPDPPLYYLLEHYWVTLAGVRPVALRGPSIVFFVIALPIVRRAAFEWYGPRAANIAVVLCGLHPLHLFFGFAARWYALAFLWTAMLLWLTARVGRYPLRRGPLAAWTLVAIAACYTNYFAVGMVAVLWLWGLLCAEQTRRRWVAALIILIVAFGAWAPPFARHVTTFPRLASGWSEYGATAGRTAAALLAGNLASPSAWYCWIGLVVFAVAMLVLALADIRRHSAPGSLALAALVSSVAGLVMIDKYTMLFSGAVLLVAAGTIARPRRGAWRQVRTAGLTGLTFGWAACGMNWAMESGWSSLRWLDPFKAVVRENIHADLFVATHPSVRYYYGCMDPSDWYGRVTPEHWRERAERVLPPIEAAVQVAAAARHGPAALPRRVCVIQASEPRGYEGDWRELEAVLSEAYAAPKESRHLSDPDAAIKDRLDPQYRHPPERIVVRVYSRAE